jgi:hypothetical protein
MDKGLIMTPTDDPRVDCWVGGSSIGAQGCFFHFKQAIRAGLRVSWLVEKVPLSAASLIQSHPCAKIFSEDVQGFTATNRLLLNFANFLDLAMLFLIPLAARPKPKGRLKRASPDSRCSDEDSYEFEFNLRSATHLANRVITGIFQGGKTEVIAFTIIIASAFQT